MKEILRLLKVLKPYSGWMLLGILLSLLSILANITLMAVSGWFIAAMAIAGAAGVSMNYFSPAAIIRASAIVRTAGRYAERLVTHEATFRLLSAIRSWFFDALQPLVPAVLFKYRSNDLFNRLQSDIDSLNDFYLRFLVPVSVAILSIIICTLFAASYSSTLAWLLLSGLSMTGILLPLLIAKLGYKPSQKQLQCKNHLRSEVIDGISGLDELMISAADHKQQDRIEQASTELLKQQRRLAVLNGSSSAFLLLASGLTMWLVLIISIPLLRSGTIEAAELAMLVLFSIAAFEAVMPLPEAFRLFGQIHAAAQRLFALIDEKPAFVEPVSPQLIPDEFNLSLNNIDLLYENARTPALLDFNLQIHAGKTIAIVGANGSGKSSVLSLISRQLQPSAGELLLGGQPLNAFDSESLYQHIALMHQQPRLFNASIKDNLLLGNPDADDQTLSAALQTAQLDDLIKTLPDGLNSWIGESGSQLSGGQAKRLAIARTLIKPHKLLMLDEPFENLDNQTANKIMQNLLTQLKGRSLIIVTHNLLSLAAFDEVIYLQQGRILARGTFVQLIKQSKVFVDFYHQSLRFE